MSNHKRIELSRRRFIAAALPLIGCRSNSRTVGAGAGSVAVPSPTNAANAVEAAELEVVKLGTLSENDRGGTAAVLLHGFGARGDDLVPLARRMMQPRTRFFVPSAPLPQGPNGRAWWRFDAEHPLRAWAGQTPPGYQPNAEIFAARASVQALLRRIRTQYSPERLVLAGFSQGGMLTLDVALAQDPPIERAASLSGVLISESAEALRRFHGHATRFFVSHGRSDTVLPFTGAEATRAQLTQAGVPVTFVPFDGGHEIPPEVVSALTEFLFA